MYEGQWDYNLRHGTGRMIFGNGDVFDGYWEDDKIGSTGSYIFNDGIRYDGEFQNGVPHGKGTEYNDKLKSKYVGEFKNG